ncbi:Hint domain-containing protein [Tateyamaria armeniaca]|uniref:Hint domain-containing protein n=1 Tax=Tateyamaria armeniaca TaxID=2518930 RepID=A0ABW8UMM1_9RHOB
MAEIDGDEGDNTINGGSSNDNIEGNGGQDSLNGGGGSDTVSGGSGNDSIDGGAGDDTVYGGDGDDTITGGSGDDVIVGGRGDDVMSAGSGSRTDTYVIRDGDGNDTITDFDPNEPDIIRFDMDEMSTYQDVLDRITTDGNDTIITYDNGSTTRLLNTDPATLSSTNFEFGPGPVCLCEGTMIETPSGPRPVEDLKVGDLVITLDHGPQPVAHVIFETVRFRNRHDRRKPIMVAQSALGPMVPDCTTILSPQHRVLVPCGAVGQDVLVPAVKLTGRAGVRRMRGRKSAQYYNLILDRHSIIMANGCFLETLLVSDFILPKLLAMGVALSAEQRNMTPARMLVSRDPMQSVDFWSRPALCG